MAAGRGVAERAAVVSLVSTVVVVAFKLVAAGLSGSVSVLAEALQSLLDVAMSFLVLWTVRAAAVPPDADHPYGHGKAEVLVSAFQMLLVLFVSGSIVWKAIERFGSPTEIAPFWGMAAMGYALVANFVVMGYLGRVARATDSEALRGEVEHLRADSLASGGVLVGLALVWLTGWQAIDPLAAVLFGLLAAFFAGHRLWTTLHQLMDGSLPESELALIREVLERHPEVRGYHNIRTHRTGPLRVVGMHVLLDDDLSFVQAHDLAEAVEDEVSQALSGALVTVHYEPCDAELEHRALVHGDAPAKLEE